MISGCLVSEDSAPEIIERVRSRTHGAKDAFLVDCREPAQVVPAFALGWIVFSNPCQRPGDCEARRQPQRNRKPWRTIEPGPPIERARVRHDVVGFFVVPE